MGRQRNFIEHKLFLFNKTETRTQNNLYYKILSCYFDKKWTM